MTKFKQMLLAAALAAPVLAAPMAQAQSSAVAIADPETAVQNSNAWKAAAAQIQTTYKAQIDQAQSRQAALQAEMKPLVDSFEAARRQPNANQASLQTQAQQIQTKETQANQELNRLLQPVQLARAYALEQLTAQLGPAVKAAVDRKKVGVLVRPNDVLFVSPSADITADVTTELNRLVPSVNTTPPAGWQPGGQAGAAPAAAPAAQPARPQTKPQGR